MWDKFRSKSRKQRSDIVEGASVGLRSSPMYHPGALAFCTAQPTPKIGQLLTAAWNLSDTCRFKTLPPREIPSSAPSPLPPGLDKKSSSVAEALGPMAKMLKREAPAREESAKESSDKLDMPPPPSPASSTCSDTGSQGLA